MYLFFFFVSSYVFNPSVLLCKFSIPSDLNHPTACFIYKSTSVTSTRSAVSLALSPACLLISLSALLFIEVVLAPVSSRHSPSCVPSPQISPVFFFFFALCTKNTLFSLLFFAGPPHPAALVRDENSSTLPPSFSLSPYEW